MAYRDRSQGFGFVYMDIESFLSKKDEWTEEGPLPLAQVKTVNFNKDQAFEKSQSKETPAPSVTPAPVSPIRTPVEQIRQNLDRLQALHHRIHVMLEELNQLGGRKKDPKGDS